MLFEKIFQLEQVLDAFSGWCPPPSGKGRGSSLHHRINLSLRGERRAPNHFASRRIGDVRILRGRRFMPGAAKIVLNVDHLRCDGGTHETSPCLRPRVGVRQGLRYEGWRSVGPGE